MPRSWRPLQLERLEERTVPSLLDGTLLVATGPSSFSYLDQSSYPTGIIGVNPSTTAQTSVSTGGLFSLPTYMAEAPNGQLYFTDITATGRGAIIALDPNTGQQRLVATGGFIDGPNVLVWMNGFLYVANEGDASSTVHNLVRIDPSTGQQRLITDGSDGSGFSVPTGMVPAPGNNVYVTDEPGNVDGSDPGSVWKINLDTGQQTAIARGGLFDHPVDLVVEASGNLLVVNTGSGSDSYSGSVVRVNPLTGVQTLISSFGQNSGLDSIEVSSDGTIYVGAISSGSTPGLIYAVNPVTGSQSIIAADGGLSQVEGIRVFHSPTPTAATATAVVSSTSSSVFGQTITFTATVSVTAAGAGTPSGTVQFQIDGRNVGSPVSVRTTGGVTSASFSIATLAVGGHTVTASYSGDNNFANSSATLSGAQVVNQASTSTAFTSSTSASVFGQAATFTATISITAPGAGTPGGTVQFQIDGRNVGSPVSVNTTGGVTTATFSIATLAVGSHTVVASYSGDSNFANSSAILSSSQVVNKASTSTALTSSTNVSVLGQAVTFTATISITAPGAGTPSGTVQFQIDGGNVGSPVSVSATGGVATASFSIATLAVGSHTVATRYSGDDNFTTSTGSLTSGAVVTSSGGGNVTIAFDATGLLRITGDSGDDAITISQVSPGVLQVAGVNTTINQSSNSATFSSVTGITISFLNGNDSVTMNQFSIPGTISITAGAGSNSVSLNAITANLISIVTAGPGKNAIALQHTASGAVTISAGDNANLALAGVSSGSVKVTAGSNATVSVSDVTSSSDLGITLGDNAQSVTVKSSSVSNLSILQTGSTGSPYFDLENDTISNTLSLAAGGGNNTVVLSHVNVGVTLLVVLGSGKNMVLADHVTALFGYIDGGVGGDNTYVDGGGNTAYVVYHFLGH